MKHTINKILANNVGELHSDLANLKNKVKKTTIELIEVYGKKDGLVTCLKISSKDRTFITNDNIRVGGYLSYGTLENYLEVTAYEFVDNASTIGVIPFTELDLDTQLMILDEVVNSYVPFKDRL